MSEAQASDQLQSIVAQEGYNRLRRCRHGLMLYNVNDLYIGRSLDLYGEYSQGEIDLFKTIVRPQDMVLDVGANIGAHTLWFARATAPGGAVMAFEPQHLVFQNLCANMALNSMKNALCYMRAVGDTPGTIRVPMLEPNQRFNFGGLSLLKVTSGEFVPIVRLDDLGLTRCRLIKIDVQGMELSVLKGALRLIEQLKPMLYVENDRPADAVALVRFIESLNYDLYWHRPPLFNPDNFHRNQENVFPRIASINMLCLPKGSPAPAMPLDRVVLPG